MQQIIKFRLISNFYLKIKNQGNAFPKGKMTAEVSKFEGMKRQRLQKVQSGVHAILRKLMRTMCVKTQTHPVLVLTFFLFSFKSLALSNLPTYLPSNIKYFHNYIYSFFKLIYDHLSFAHT